MTNMVKMTIIVVTMVVVITDGDHVMMEALTMMMTMMTMVNIASLPLMCTICNWNYEPCVCLVSKVLLQEVGESTPARACPLRRHGCL